MKQDESWITAIICVNADGSEKTLIWYIGHYENPRCFNENNRSSLGCHYQWNSTAWNISVIMQEWLLWFQKQAGNRQVALLLDNFSVHECAVAELEDEDLLPTVHMIWLPSGTTSEYQPLDQGIIRTWKPHSW